MQSQQLSFLKLDTEKENHKIKNNNNNLFFIKFYKRQKITQGI